MGETRVDLLHLLEDLRDAYSGSLEETIVTEIVANSLDSGATAAEDSVRFHDFAFADELSFEKLAPGTFAALASSFTEYKNQP